MKELLKSICDDSKYKVAHNTKGITLDAILEASCQDTSIVPELMSRFNCSKGTVSRALKLTFPDRDPIKDSSIRRFLLNKRSLKLCKKCNSILKLSEDNFYLNSSRKDGFSDYCRECSKDARKNTYAKDPIKEIVDNTRRELENENRVPKWADLKAIENFYRNRPDGYHVDHIIPLRGENISGLHVLSNLQYLPASENLSKKNKY